MHQTIKEQIYSNKTMEQIYSSLCTEQEFVSLQQLVQQTIKKPVYSNFALNHEGKNYSYFCTEW